MSFSPDLDDTSGCSLATTCHGCGGTSDLDIATLLTPVGVYCATLCGACVDANRLPAPTSWADACTRVGEHCGHLGIDLDQMGAALAAERGGR